MVFVMILNIEKFLFLFWMEKLGVLNLSIKDGYKILAYLDIKSLLHCTQVSKAWNDMIDGKRSETLIWKKRLIEQGFALESQLSKSYLQQFPNPFQYVNLYKAVYRHLHLTRQNWFLGRYRKISFIAQETYVVTALHYNGENIMYASDAGTIHIYNATRGELVRTLEGHEGGVWALQYWQNILVSGSTDRTVRVWNMDTGRCTHVFDGHTSTVRCLLIMIPTLNESNGKMEPSIPLIVTGSRDATLRVWKLPDPNSDDTWTPEDGTNPYFLHLLSGHTNSVRAIAGAGNTLVSGSYDTTVRVWNLLTGECSFVFQGHREKVYSVGYSPELNRAASGSMDSTVKVWCTLTGELLFTLEGHTSLVGLLELTPKYLIS
ncbi:WD40-repeat-containing domain protein, partial [Globomyces pollinis-pini]